MGQNYYEQMELGSVTVSNGRTVTETDLVLATTLVGLNDTIHSDLEAMKNTKFGERLVPGFFTFGLTLGLLHGVRQMKSIGLLEVKQLRYPSPVLPGDTITARSEIVGKRESKSNPRAGLVTMRDSATNQRGEVVIEYERVVMYERRPS